MFGDGSLTFREFMMREPLPLATIHDAILFEFLPGREDAVLFGAQAVNAYVDEPRMTQDVDIASPRAEELVEELKDFLNKKFHIAVRTRSGARGHRLSYLSSSETEESASGRYSADRYPAAPSAGGGCFGRHSAATDLRKGSQHGWANESRQGSHRSSGPTPSVIDVPRTEDSGGSGGRMPPGGERFAESVSRLEGTGCAGNPARR